MKKVNIYIPLLLVLTIWNTADAQTLKTEVPSIEFEIEPGTEAVYSPWKHPNGSRILQINTVKQPKNVFAGAAYTWDGQKDKYCVTLFAIQENDGEGTYKVYVNEKLLGEQKVPRTTATDYPKYPLSFGRVKLRQGDVIRVESSSNSNQLIPEGEGYAWARGRWDSLLLFCD